MQIKQLIFFCLALLLCHQLRAQNNNNTGFEFTAPGSYTTANAVSDWTVSSQSNTACVTNTVWTPGSPEFSIVSTPVFNIPGIGTLPASPLGGNNVAQLNDFMGSSNVTKISQNIQVNNTNSLFQYALAMVFEDMVDLCCSMPQFKLIVKDCAGTVIPALTMTIVPMSANCMATSNLSLTCNQVNCFNWSNWQTYYLDLSPYLGSCVTVEVICSDGTNANYYGSVFFDSRLGGFLVPGTFVGASLNTQGPINFCTNSNLATITAPLGYISYTWQAANGNTIGNSQVLTIANPVAGSVYTVGLTTFAGYTSYVSYTLATTQTSIVAIGSTPSCPLSSTGSASVISTGNSGFCFYTWYNQNSQVVASASVATNLAPGIYTVVASGYNGGCGIATATVAVGTTTINSSKIIKPYCNNQQAYLISPVNGTNYQWYNDASVISANLGGTVNAYIVMAPANGDVYRLSYQSPNGCLDSISFYLSASPPGSLAVISNSLICANGTNGVVVFSLTPAANSPLASISFSAWVLPASVSYSTSPFPSANKTFTLNNLLAGTNYSINAFDGLCKYTSIVSPNRFSTPNFSFTPASTTLCAGQTLIAGVILPNAVAFSYSISWIPNMFLWGNINNLPITSISPTVSPGGISTTIYTIVLTPTAINCPFSGNISVTMADLQNQILNLNPIPDFCTNSPGFTVSATPPGGTFYNTNTGMLSSVITPSLSTPGVHSFKYSFLPGTCASNITGFYTVNTLPQVSVTGNTLFCLGKTTTLTAAGADTYTWSNSSVSSSIIVTPSTNTTYSVGGTYTSTSCMNTAAISVSIKPLPVVGANGTRSICLGATTTLSPFGADSYYSWNPFIITTTCVISPTVTTSYTLTGTNLSQCSNTAVITITVTRCDTMATGLDEQQSKNHSLKMYPNPNGGIFSVELPSAAEITIYDALGNLILEAPLHSGIQLINISMHANGIYFLKCTNGPEIKTIKFVKTD